MSTRLSTVMLDDAALKRLLSALDLQINTFERNAAHNNRPADTVELHLLRRQLEQHLHLADQPEMAGKVSTDVG